MEHEKTDLYIGGTRGIGRELAVEGLKRSRHAIVVGRNAVHDDALAKATRLTGYDVASDMAWERLKHERIWHARRIFWVAGAYARGPLAETSPREIERAVAMHQTAMVRMIQQAHRCRIAWRDLEDDKVPGRYDIVAIGSVSSYALRKHEAVYAMAKAGQAAFLRAFAAELAEDFPGSRVLLANCARLGDKPGEQKLDAGGRRIDPRFVAKLLHDLLDGQDGIASRPFTQVNIERDSDGPVLSYGPKTPEIP